MSSLKLHVYMHIVSFLFLLCLGSDHFNGIDLETDDGITYILNRVYYMVMTVSTVGYGDITPKSTLARLLTLGIIINVLLHVVYRFNVPKHYA